VFAPALTPEAVYREVAEINHEIALVAVGCAGDASQGGRGEGAAEGRSRPSRLRAVRSRSQRCSKRFAGEGAAAKGEDPGGPENNGGEINHALRTARAIGAPTRRLSLRVFRDSHSLRTGKVSSGWRSEHSMNSNFRASAVLVKTERKSRAGPSASFENAYEPVRSDGIRYSANGAGHGGPRHEDREENIARKRAVRPGRSVFDGHH